MIVIQELRPSSNVTEVIPNGTAPERMEQFTQHLAALSIGITRPYADSTQAYGRTFQNLTGPAKRPTRTATFTEETRKTSLDLILESFETGNIVEDDLIWYVDTIDSRVLDIDYVLLNHEGLISEPTEDSKEDSKLAASSEPIKERSLAPHEVAEAERLGFPFAATQYQTGKEIEKIVREARKTLEESDKDIKPDEREHQSVLLLQQHTSLGYKDSKTGKYVPQVTMLNEAYLDRMYKTLDQLEESEQITN